MYSESVRRRALDLIDEGWSERATAREIGVSRGAIREWIRLGVTPVTRPTKCFRCDPQQSADCARYAYLLGLYLGDGCLSKAGDRGVLILRISCADAWPGLIDACEQAMGILGTRTRRIQLAGCTDVASYSKHWPCLFPQHGPGRKHERSIELAGWQAEIALREAPFEFVRGLIHSDGCRVINRVTAHGKQYAYVRYFFSNRSTDIRRLLMD